jgi:fucose permease
VTTLVPPDTGDPGDTAERAAAGPAAARATYVAFIACGFGVASWASRIPQIRDGLHLSSSALGLVLLTLAAGSVTALLVAGAVVSRFHARRAVAVSAVLEGVALAGIGLGYLFGVVPVVVGLFVFGLATATWDVAMNVQGAAVERRLGRAIMPRFHAGYSVGTVAGALVGAAAVALHVPVTAHLVAVAVVVAVAVPVAVRDFLPDVETPAAGAATEPAGQAEGGTWRRWREPRTVLIGLVVLAFAFAEGAGVDWIGVALIDGYGLSAVLGTLGFAAFLTAMTLARWFGDRALARYGRVAVVRTQAVVAVVGVLLFVAGPSAPVAFVGVLLWGAGVSLGFPVGMSAAADEPAAAAGRVSVVASIGYCAFLAGPPLIGYLSRSATTHRAVIAVAVVLGVVTLVIGALRPLPAADDGQPAARG